MNRVRERLGGIDVAIVGRGGGSLEDLWAFNEELVARAIARSEIPVVSAVGHEVDVSIADLVADVRAATPTAAAELVAPRKDDLLAALDQYAGRATRCVQHRFDIANGALTAVETREPLARPLARLHVQTQRIDEQVHCLRHALSETLRTRRETLTAAQLTILRYGTGATFAKLTARIERGQYRMQHALDRLAGRSTRRISDALARLERRSPLSRTARDDERLGQLVGRLHAAMRQSLRQSRTRLTGRIASLEAASPERILKRGYSITRDARTRRVLRSIEEIRDGLRVTTELADGAFRSTADDPKQPGLFD